MFVITVDYNRVVLEPEEGVPDSDYINASYVDVSITNVTYCLVPHSSNPVMHTINLSKMHYMLRHKSVLYERCLKALNVNGLSFTKDLKLCTQLRINE